MTEAEPSTPRESRDESDADNPDESVGEFVEHALTLRSRGRTLNDARRANPVTNYQRGGGLRAMIRWPSSLRT